MADEVDDAIFSVSAFDNFSDTLDDLEDDLRKIEAEVQKVDPVDLDAEVGDAIADVTALKTAVGSLDDETVHVDVESDSALFGMGGEEWRDKQMFGNMQTDKKTMRDLFGVHTQGVWDGVIQDDNPFEDTDPDKHWDIPLFDEDTELSHPHPLDGGGMIRAGDRGLGGLADGRTPGPREQRKELFGQADPISGLLDADEELGGTGMFLGAGDDDDGPTAGERLRDAFRDFKQLRLSMGMFMNLMASLIPLLGVFVGALPAAIAGVVALGAAAVAAAAAMYGIAGLGVMALAMEGGEWNFQALKEQTQGLIRTFMDAFGPLANAIEPLMLDLLGNIQMAMFGVAQHMRPLLSLTDDARRIFNTLLGMVGPFVEDTIRFADAMLPVFEMFGSVLGNIDMYAMFGQMLEETLPALFAITSAIGKALPAIYDMSLGFLAVATSVTWFLTGFLRLLDLIPFGIELFGYLTGITLTLLSATALYSLATGTLATRLGALVAATAKYIAAATYNIYVTYGLAAAVGTLAASLAVLLGLLTLGIVPVVAGVSSQFSVLGNDIKDATGSLREFNREAGRVSNISPGMEGARYTQPGSGTVSGGTSAGATGSGVTNVYAPDQETGNSIINTMTWKDDDDDDDVNNRLHGV